MKELILELLEQNDAGSITVTNKGAYVAAFSITYKLKNRQVTQHSGNFTNPTNQALNIPSGATEIFLKIEEMVFFRTWSAFHTERFDMPVTKCYSISGTTLNPKCKEVPC